MAAASVSRIMCFVFSTTASGSAREPASLMYVLSVVMIGLTAPGFAAAAASCAARTASGATTDAASTPPACLRRSRLFIVALLRSVRLQADVAVRLKPDATVRIISFSPLMRFSVTTVRISCPWFVTAGNLRFSSSPVMS